MWKKKSDGSLEPVLRLKNISEPYNTARQLLPKIFAQTGTLDIIKTDTILKKNSMTGKKIYPLFIDKEYYVDIDTFSSLKIAETIIKINNCVKP